LAAQRDTHTHKEADVGSQATGVGHTRPAGL
jgi:hypothetical protein